MMKTDNSKTVSVKPDNSREQWLTDRAKRCAISQGYSQETAEAFAKWAQDYCPEVQGFSNLFDYFMTKGA